MIGPYEVILDIDVGYCVSYLCEGTPVVVFSGPQGVCEDFCQLMNNARGLSLMADPSRRDHFDRMTPPYIPGKRSK